MAVWVCLDCSTRFLVGLSGCPHCGSTIYREEDDMPKISKEGGDSAVTNALAESEPAVQEMLQAEADRNEIPEDRVDLEARGSTYVDADGAPVDPEDVPYGATVQRANEGSPTAPVEPVEPVAAGADGTGEGDAVKASDPKTAPKSEAAKAAKEEDAKSSSTGSSSRSSSSGSSGSSSKSSSTSKNTK